MTALVSIEPRRTARAVSASIRPRVGFVRPCRTRRATPSRVPATTSSKKPRVTVRIRTAAASIRP
eukprot:907184-Rhodomonas_salina.1